MEDFNVLAISLGQGMADVRGCLVLSRDGLVLGAHPAESERATTRAWIRFATIGDPERGFVQFGTETWCYVRRAPYAGFAVAGPEERAGLVIDHMEQVLEAAEERRSQMDGPHEAEAATEATRSEPRPYLDLERPAPDPLVIDAPASIQARFSDADSPEPAPRPFSPEPEMIAGPIRHVAETIDDQVRDAETLDDPVRDDADTVERPADPFAELDVDASEPDARPSWERTPSFAISDPERWPLRDPRPDEEPALEPVDEADEGSGAGPEVDPGLGLEPEGKAAEEEKDDVDRFSLAREFGRLLQGGEGPTDG